MDRFLTGPEVDERLGIGRVTRWKLIKEGKLPKPYRLTPNGHQKFSEKAINELMEAASTTPSHEPAAAAAARDAAIEQKHNQAGEDQTVA